MMQVQKSAEMENSQVRQGASGRVERVAEPSEPLGTALVRKARRARKFARRLALNAVHGKPDTRVVFIMGAQRSGTRVPLFVLESAPDIVTYREGSGLFFRGKQLREEEALDRLFADCDFPILVLKPLCESHRARELVKRFQGSRVLWVFRGYEDTVRSASIKWRSGIDAVEQIVHGRLAPHDWRHGGLTPELLETARQLYEPGLSLHHANAILWYLRSRLAIDLDVFQCPDVLVIKYEDFTSAPVEHFTRVFEFIGQPLKREYLDIVQVSSRQRRSPLDIPKRVSDACEGLYAEMEQHYRRGLHVR